MKYLILIFLSISSVCLAKLNVATTSTDLAALVKEVGKDKVDVFAIAKGTQDLHQIEAKPSFMVKLRSVDLVISHGLELESAWIVPLIQGARNQKLNEKTGLYELASELDPIDIPKGNLSRAEGDVHPGGNPHFQLDPIRLGKAALLIAAKLGNLEPSDKDYYQKNAEAFDKHIQEKTKEWQARVKKIGTNEIVTYHKTFSYFCDRFSLKCDLQLEPKPGIPPTASHILEVINQMKKRDLHIVFIENLYEDSVGEKLRQSIPKVFVKRVPVSVEGAPGISTNEQLIENMVKTLEEASR